MKDSKKILVMGGAGNAGNTKLSKAIRYEVDKLITGFSGPIELKDCHKTEQEKKFEENNKFIAKMRSQLTVDVLDEYKLIQKKASNLSRKNRDNIESYINRLITNGMLTQEEEDYLKQ